MAQFRNATRLQHYIHENVTKIMLYYLYTIITGVIIIMNHHPWQEVFDNNIFRYKKNVIIHYVTVATNCEILKQQLPDCHVGDSVKIQPFASVRLHTRGMTCLQRCFRPSLLEDTEKVSLWNIMFLSEQWPSFKVFCLKETKTVCMHLLFSHAIYMSCPSHPSLV